jgi:hypothetical protein
VLISECSRVFAKLSATHDRLMTEELLSYEADPAIIRTRQCKNRNHTAQALFTPPERRRVSVRAFVETSASKMKGFTCRAKI